MIFVSGKCADATLVQLTWHMAVFHDEVEIEDFDYDEETETYSYPCPCGDIFTITKVGSIVLLLPVADDEQPGGPRGRRGHSALCHMLAHSARHLQCCMS